MLFWLMNPATALSLSVAFAAGAWGIFVLWPVAIGAGFQPTSKTTVRRMLEIAKVGPDDVVYDLGSGDGRLLIISTKERGARSVGIEADPLRVLWSRTMLARAGVKDAARVKWGNFFHETISDATVVTLFLMEGTNAKLKAKFKNELAPGTRIVSHVWRIEGWQPSVVDKERNVYLYIV